MHTGWYTKYQWEKIKEVAACKFKAAVQGTEATEEDIIKAISDMRAKMERARGISLPPDEHEQDLLEPAASEEARRYSRLLNQAEKSVTKAAGKKGASTKRSKGKGTGKSRAEPEDEDDEDDMEE